MNKKGNIDGVLILITAISVISMIVFIQLFSFINNELNDIKKRAIDLNIAKIIILPKNSSYLLFNGEKIESICIKK